MSKNPIAQKITSGLTNWKKISEVEVLKNGELIVPRIISGASKDAVLICTGLHLEETSGPLTFLDPKNLSTLLKITKKKNITLIIYPLINNFGLGFSLKEDERFLRRNKDGINYNDGWGMAKRAKEVALVEKDILGLIKKYNVKVALSLHEDSITPKKGYLWTNAVKKRERFKIYEYVKKNVPENLRLQMTEKSILGGIVEEGISIADSKDDGAFENWMAEILNIPTVLSEAPFKASLANRRKFHLEVVKASISVYFPD